MKHASDKSNKLKVKGVPILNRYYIYWMISAIISKVIKYLMALHEPVSGKVLHVSTGVLAIDLWLQAACLCVWKVSYHFPNIWTF